MKKLLLAATVLLGTVAASQAGIDIHIGLPLPPLPRVIVAPPAPVILAPAPPVVCEPAPVVVIPRPVVIVRPPVYGYGYPHRHGRHGYPGWAYYRGYYCR